MQTFYDKLIASEKESQGNWKRQLTEVDLEEIGVIVESSRAWQQWGEGEESE